MTLEKLKIKYTNTSNKTVTKTLGHYEIDEINKQIVIRDLHLSGDQNSAIELALALKELRTIADMHIVNPRNINNISV